MKVKYGLKNVHIAPITAESDSEITYGSIFAMPGAVNLTLDPEGDKTEFAADNNPNYFEDENNQGYTGSLEIALIVNAFRTQILGQTQDANGAFIENQKDKFKKFALGFQIDGDDHDRKYWIYNVSVKRPSTSSQTTDKSKTPSTDTLNITASPRRHDGAVKVDLEPTNDNTATYNSFFESVYEKTGSV